MSGGVVRAYPVHFLSHTFTLAPHCPLVKAGLKAKVARDNQHSHQQPTASTAQQSSLITSGSSCTEYLILKTNTSTTAITMFSNPLPYNPRWAAKLLRRDVRELKTKVASKIKARFSPSSPSSPSPPSHPQTVQEHVDVVPTEVEVLRDIESPEPAAHSAVSTSSLPLQLFRRT